ncbi:hypothetical protein B0H66DRAFT_529374 [Apodospora peruviana]|uniref:DUF7791 domain-containing protein n=1 Tax=Apodospora peruviana TaxID=516989 RepID=A0AAE0IHZ0_9PEZI|nr:hypothetical protein B0H66DRAFT_529374 [Apodospora peruviana]
MTEHPDYPKATRTSSHNTHQCGSIPLAELKHAFLLLAEELPKDLKLCLFIDGLDEYDGSHQDIIDLFQLLVVRVHLRGVLPTLREAPDARFTRADIQNYVCSNLFETERMRVMEARDPTTASKLMEDVVSKSSGVWLWVVLVVRILREGLADGSTLDELRQMMEEYPEELRNLYELVFERMNPRHRKQAFRMPLFLARVYEVEGGLPSLLRLSFLDQDTTASLKRRVKREPAGEIEETLATTKARLRNSPSPEEDDHIVFLHRTVSEFLQETQPTLYEETAEERYDPDLYLLASILWNFKTRDIFSRTPKTAFKLFHPTILAFFRYCQASERTFPGRVMEYTDEFVGALNEYWQMRGTVLSLPATWAHSFMPNDMHSNLPSEVLPAVSKHFQLHRSLRQYLHRKSAAQTGPVPDTTSKSELMAELPEWVSIPVQSAFNKYRGDIPYTPSVSNRQRRQKTKARHFNINGEDPKHLPTSWLRGLEVSNTYFRCKASHELLDMGFDPASVLVAMETAGVGTDISALWSWSLGRASMSDDIAVVDTGHRTASQRSQAESHKRSLLRRCHTHGRAQTATDGQRSQQGRSNCNKKEQ